MLTSITAEDQHRLLTSSGTQGPTSKITLDSETAQLQSRILTKTLQHWLRKQRLPMLVIDAKATIQKKAGMSARAAGIQGMLFFGRDPHFALNDDMTLNIEVIEQFFEKYKDTPVFMFGFTLLFGSSLFNSWCKWGNAIRFQKACYFMVAAGKMQQSAVSNDVFKQQIAQSLGAISVHDYYGMVEQTGTIYIECEHGHLHAPVWSDITVADAATAEPLGINQAA